MNCALILGRHHSSGFPGKNLHKVRGRPMVEFPLLAASRAENVGRVYVSTDSPPIKELAKAHGAAVIERPAHLATDEALSDDAFVHGYREIRAELQREGEEIGLLALMLANAPTITSELIDEGMSALQADDTLDSAVSVSRYNMWSPIRARRIADDGLLEPFFPLAAVADPATMSCDRDSQGDVWFADMGVSVVRPRCFENIESGTLPQRLMGRRIHPLRQWGGLDVDYEWQVPQVEFWLSAHEIGEEPSSPPETRTPDTEV